MPTLSPRSAPFPPRVSSGPTHRRPADSRPPTPGDQCRATRLRHSKGTLAVAIIIVGLTAAGCGQYADSTATATAATPVTQQECVSAVYTVLTGMIAKPDDDQPFDDFVTRYGTTSPDLRRLPRQFRSVLQRGRRTRDQSRRGGRARHGDQGLLYNERHRFTDKRKPAN